MEKYLFCLITVFTPKPLSPLTIFQWLNLGVLLHLGSKCQVEEPPDVGPPQRLSATAQTNNKAQEAHHTRAHQGLRSRGAARNHQAPYQMLIYFFLVIQDVLAMNFASERLADAYFSPSYIQKSDRNMFGINVLCLQFRQQFHFIQNCVIQEGTLTLATLPLSHTLNSPSEKDSTDDMRAQICQGRNTYLETVFKILAKETKLRHVNRMAQSPYPAHGCQLSRQAERLMPCKYPAGLHAFLSFICREFKKLLEIVLIFRVEHIP